MTEQPPAVEVRSLHVQFGDVEAVAGVDLDARAGQATALLGRNGAGKSTTMRVLAGVIPPTAGTATVAGIDVRRNPLAVKRVTGYQDPDDPTAEIGLAAFLRRADDLADTYGERFRPTAYLRELQAKGESFPA